MANYAYPGVYIEEISTFPPSVAEVSTAIPAFIGYTERGPAGSEVPKIVRINTLLEYQMAFGTSKPRKFSVKAERDEQTKLWTITELERAQQSAGNTDFTLYDCLNLYFKNGGGSCYIVSIGNYQDTPDIDRFEAGLAALEKEDEPTLIVFSDALKLSATDYYVVCQQSLAQCKKLGDRFSIIDVPDGQDQITAFRTNIGNNDLMYGAAYYPYLQTALTYSYQEDEVTIEKNIPGVGLAVEPVWSKTYPEDGNGITVAFSGQEGDTPKVRIVAGNSDAEISFEVNEQTLTISNAAGKTGNGIVTSWTAWNNETDIEPGGFNLTISGDGTGSVPHTFNSNDDLTWQTGSQQPVSMAESKEVETALYNQLKTELNDQRIILPPSAAIAGVYARVDRDRGVWKAPANVSLASVTGPAIKITDEVQGGLNLDTEAGKSINAIRAFTGKGILVWGARTLAGNDNEWRYVPVRRLFNMIEESTKKATAFAVFEPNDATTWLKVKAMIESYLFGLWERGALAGSTSEAAYFVNVGLGKTMTAQDILNGHMIVVIGIAAVRPAEFIILRFTHRLQES